MSTRDWLARNPMFDTSCGQGEILDLTLSNSPPPSKMESEPPPPSPTPSDHRASKKIRADKPIKPRSQPTVSPDLQLTFGVEIECCLVYRESWVLERKEKLAAPLIAAGEPFAYDEYTNTVPLIQQHVRNVLEEAGIPMDSPQWVPSYVWQMDTDTSLTNEDDNGSDGTFGFYQMEIKSPIMKFCSKALDQVRLVVKTLSEKLNDEGNLSLKVNESCGIHVHVGSHKRVVEQMENAGIPFTTARNLFTFGDFFEKQTNAVFPEHRLDGIYAKPVHRMFPGPGGVHGVARRIEGFSGYRETLKSFGPPFGPGAKLSVYNIENMAHYPEDLYKTIEFRQHHGSLDPDEVSNWIRFVCGLIRVCHHVGEIGFPIGFLARHMDEEFSFLDLLDSLNMQELKEHYGKPGKLYDHKTPAPDTDSPSSTPSETESERRIGGFLRDREAARDQDASKALLQGSDGSTDVQPEGNDATQDESLAKRLHQEAEEGI